MITLFALQSSIAEVIFACNEFECQMRRCSTIFLCRNDDFVTMKQHKYTQIFSSNIFDKCYRKQQKRVGFGQMDLINCLVRKRQVALVQTKD